MTPAPQQAPGLSKSQAPGFASPGTSPSCHAPCAARCSALSWLFIVAASIIATVGFGFLAYTSAVLDAPAVELEGYASTAKSSPDFITVEINPALADAAKGVLGFSAYRSPLDQGSRRTPCLLSAADEGWHSGKATYVSGGSTTIRVPLCPGTPALNSRDPFADPNAYGIAVLFRLKEPCQRDPQFADAAEQGGIGYGDVGIPIFELLHAASDADTPLATLSLGDARLPLSAAIFSAIACAGPKTVAAQTLDVQVQEAHSADGDVTYGLQLAASAGTKYFLTHNGGTPAAKDGPRGSFLTLGAKEAVLPLSGEVAICSTPVLGSAGTGEGVNWGSAFCNDTLRIARSAAVAGSGIETEPPRYSWMPEWVAWTSPAACEILHRGYSSRECFDVYCMPRVIRAKPALELLPNGPPCALVIANGTRPGPGGLPLTEGGCTLRLRMEAMVPAGWDPATLVPSPLSGAEVLRVLRGQYTPPARSALTVTIHGYMRTSEPKLMCRGLQPSPDAASVLAAGLNTDFFGLTYVTSDGVPTSCAEELGQFWDCFPFLPGAMATRKPPPGPLAMLLLRASSTKRVTRYSRQKASILLVAGSAAGVGAIVAVLLTAVRGLVVGLIRLCCRCCGSAPPHHRLADIPKDKRRKDSAGAAGDASPDLDGVPYGDGEGGADSEDERGALSRSVSTATFVASPVLAAMQHYRSPELTPLPPGVAGASLR